MSDHQVMTLFDDNPTYTPTKPAPTIDESFQHFHQANPFVYTALVTLARDIHTRGHSTGVKMLFEILRWQWMRRTTDQHSDFKLNNSYTSRYARLIMEQEPDLAGVFQTRRIETP